MTITEIFDPAGCMSNALNAVADKRVTRNTMAIFYADLLRCPRNSIDWVQINTPIIARWPKGIAYIKGRAWKIATEIELKGRQ